MMYAVVTYQLDLLAFGILCLMAMGALHIRIRRTRYRKGVPLASWLVLATLLALGGILTRYVGDHENRSIRSALEGFAPTYAKEMEQLGHARLPNDARPDDPLYLAMIAAQIRWQHVASPVNDIYTLRKLPDGSIIFVVDSETDYNRNGSYDGDREKRTEIGEKFDDVDEKILAAFAGQSCFDNEPAVDRWGTWISAYCPIYDINGNVEAVLGVDYNATQWLASIARHRLGALVLVGAIVVIHIVATGSICRHRMLADERAWLASHDRLTGLPNRMMLNDRLARALEQAREASNRHFALIFLDLDGFKIINDSLGHEAGDLLLIEISRRLCRALHIGDEAAVDSHSRAMPVRLGGDEFVVLLNDIGNVQEATAVAQQIQAVISTPFVLAGREVRVTASIGITCSDGKYAQAGAMLRDSDAAMYAAKNSGKARFAIFDQAMHDRALARLSLEQDLHKAVELGQLRLVYQPIICLTRGTIVGFEALLRWQHPQHGNMDPSQFIPLAEETGLIVPIGTWVLEEACRTLVRLRSLHPSADFYMSVNVSRRQWSIDGWTECVSRIVHQTGAEPNRLRLEITESTIMANPEASIRTLQQLRSMGIGIYIDNFGTGHSSLACLHHFPLTGLKLDGAFIANMSAKPEYTALVSAIISLGYILDLQLIAEGIERAEQIVVLQSLGCHQAQGYLFAPPLSVDRAEHMLINGLPPMVCFAQSPVEQSSKPHDLAA